MGMTEFGAPDSNHSLTFLPGVVILKARTTVMVFAKMVETASEYDSKCHLLEDAGGTVGRASDE